MSSKPPICEASGLPITFLHGTCFRCLCCERQAVVWAEDMRDGPPTSPPEGWLRKGRHDILCPDHAPLWEEHQEALGAWRDWFAEQLEPLRQQHQKTSKSLREQNPPPTPPWEDA